MYQIDYIESAKFNIQLLRICGAWVTPEASIPYKIYALFMQLLTGYTFMVNMCLMLPYQHDLESFMLSFPISLAMIAFSIKLTNLYLRRHQIQNFFILLNSAESQVQEKEEFEIISQANRIAKKLIYFWFVIFFVAGLSAISPLASYDPKLPYPIFYPDWREGPNMFYISCVYQIICVMIASSCNGAVDAFISYFLTVLSGMVDALCWKLKTLKQADKNDVLIRQDFLKCIRRHRHLILIAAEIQNVFSTVTFTQIFLSGVIICGLLFQLSLLSPLKDPKIFFKLSSFASAMFIQIFIPCYTANEVRIKCGNLMLSIYTSDWLVMSQRMKKLIVIFMQRLQRPILITIGGIIFLGMENFMAVLRFSYSLYSLLRRVHAE